ncbi:MAG: DUF559 domain-containing protein [Candidatus Marinimicrobia bacterium]|nr:DUF559 domain-containing protein [Candidatus Neomarinimicrobiota bacterium]
MIKNCLICGKEFRTYLYLIKKGYGKYCSNKCYTKWLIINYRGKNHPCWKGGERKKECLNCGKEFFVKHCYINKRSKFCSHKCKGKWMSKNLLGEKNSCWRGGKIEKQCLVCGKSFFVFPHSIKAGYGKFCSQSCSTIYMLKHNRKKNTSIELKVEEYLKKSGVKFESQKVIPEGRTIADFYIPEQRLVIYADGKYWHGRPEVKNRDQQQDFQLGFNGYKVLRLGEDEINSGKFSKKLPYRAV